VTVGEPLGLYLHIPFCESICNYCNFNRGLLDPVLKTRYIDALTTEINAVGDGTAVDTIYFGGGPHRFLTRARWRGCSTPVVTRLGLPSRPR